MLKTLMLHVSVGRNYAINKKGLLVMVCYAIAFQSIVILKANWVYNLFSAYNGVNRPVYSSPLPEM